MPKKPLFSIITVTYNAQESLTPTMLSVAGQSFSDYEHLIIDGASTDATLKIANDLATFATIISSSPDRGIYDAMNKGMSLASGQYLIFLNAGDALHSPNTLSQIADAITSSAIPPGVVYGQTLIVDSDRNRVSERHLLAPRHLDAKSFENGMVVCHQAFIVNASIAPTYNLAFRFSSDFDWCIRSLQKSLLNIYIDDYLIDYLNEGMTTANHKASLKERFKIMCQHYGAVPTIFRHAAFAFRFAMRKMRHHDARQ